MFESELMVKEPHNKGCMSRGLAVARPLQQLELRPEGKGKEIELAMVEVFQAMVAFQLQTKHLQHQMVKPRVKTRIEEQRTQDRADGQ